ncbi:small ribosomal subunit Rsm22 family protein [Roseiflexus sp.]|uniref:small ribosomal subunit Rsm22 family protein n=1 Tax=Roseiflexus sp. TaxID=2562120 RepID=UPI00398B27A9
MIERLPPDPRMIALPAELRSAIAQALDKTSETRWMNAARALSEQYRACDDTDAAPAVRTHFDALGYAALLMPATYAQLYGALNAAAARIPSWTPETMLDMGSGPGTALWAATVCWSSLRELTAWEREPALIALGRDFARASANPVLRSTRWVQRTLQTPAERGLRFDLVVIGHVLGEIPLDDRSAIVEIAWQLTRGMLVIVEPGTPAGFAVVRAARDQLLGNGGTTIAPCPHDHPCPLSNDWCHFPQRLRRPEFQRRARGAPSPWEDAKYSYAALARFPPERPVWGRVIREPTFNKAYAEVMISSRDGVVRHRALKRDREAFRWVKHLEWGQTLEEQP